MNAEVVATVEIGQGTSGLVWITDGGTFNQSVQIGPLIDLPKTKSFSHTYAETGTYGICLRVISAGVEVSGQHFK